MVITEFNLNIFGEVESVVNSFGETLPWQTVLENKALVQNFKINDTRSITVPKVGTSRLIINKDNTSLEDIQSKYEIIDGKLLSEYVEYIILQDKNTGKQIKLYQSDIIKSVYSSINFEKFLKSCNINYQKDNNTVTNNRTMHIGISIPKEILLSTPEYKEYINNPFFHKVMLVQGSLDKYMYIDKDGALSIFKSGKEEISLPPVSNIDGLEIEIPNAKTLNIHRRTVKIKTNLSNNELIEKINFGKSSPKLNYYTIKDSTNLKEIVCENIVMFGVIHLVNCDKIEKLQLHILQLTHNFSQFIENKPKLNEITFVW